MPSAKSRRTLLSSPLARGTSRWHLIEAGGILRSGDGGRRRGRDRSKSMGFC
jgi:hypothetical protein